MDRQIVLKQTEKLTRKGHKNKTKKTTTVAVQKPYAAFRNCGRVIFKLC